MHLLILQILAFATLIWISGGTQNGRREEFNHKYARMKRISELGDPVVSPHARNRHRRQEGTSRSSGARAVPLPKPIPYASLSTGAVPERLKKRLMASRVGSSASSGTSSSASESSNGNAQSGHSSGYRGQGSNPYNPMSRSGYGSPTYGQTGAGEAGGQGVPLGRSIYPFTSEQAIAGYLGRQNPYTGSSVPRNPYVAAGYQAGGYPQSGMPMPQLPQYGNLMGYPPIYGGAYGAAGNPYGGVGGVYGQPRIPVNPYGGYYGSSRGYPDATGVSIGSAYRDPTSRYTSYLGPVHHAGLTGSYGGSYGGSGSYSGTNPGYSGSYGGGSDPYGRSYGGYTNSRTYGGGGSNPYGGSAAGGYGGTGSGSLGGSSGQYGGSSGSYGRSGSYAGSSQYSGSSYGTGSGTSDSASAGYGGGSDSYGGAVGGADGGTSDAYNSEGTSSLGGSSGGYGGVSGRYSYNSGSSLSGSSSSQQTGGGASDPYGGQRYRGSSAIGQNPYSQTSGSRYGASSSGSQYGPGIGSSEYGYSDTSQQSGAQFGGYGQDSSGSSSGRTYGTADSGYADTSRSGGGNFGGYAGSSYYQGESNQDEQNSGGNDRSNSGVNTGVGQSSGEGKSYSQYYNPPPAGAAGNTGPSFSGYPQTYQSGQYGASQNSEDGPNPNYQTAYSPDSQDSSDQYPSYGRGTYGGVQGSSQTSAESAGAGNSDHGVAQPVVASEERNPVSFGSDESNGQESSSHEVMPRGNFKYQSGIFSIQRGNAAEGYDRIGSGERNRTETPERQDSSDSEHGERKRQRKGKLLKNSSLRKCSKSVNGLPDLYIDHRKLRRSIFLDKKTLKELACAKGENCLAKSAYIPNPNYYRKLLRFETTAHNNGTAVFLPALSPDDWYFHKCHDHYHSMKEFAHYHLLHTNGTLMEEGHKPSFCLEDSGCKNPCPEKYKCKNRTQGISPGCYDTYKASRDCQWIDVTDVPPGEYTLRVTVNPLVNGTREVKELSYKNNIVECQLIIMVTQVEAIKCWLKGMK